jgi:hypothetical protein
MSVTVATRTVAVVMACLLVVVLMLSQPSILFVMMMRVGVFLCWQF